MAVNTIYASSLIFDFIYPIEITSFYYIGVTHEGYNSFISSVFHPSNETVPRIYDTHINIAMYIPQDPANPGSEPWHFFIYMLSVA